MALERLGTGIDMSRYVKKTEASLMHEEELVAAQEKNRYISTSQQWQAARLWHEFGDPEHKIYYLALCKKLKPEVIDAAYSFVQDAHARSRAKLFMWKIKQIIKDWRERGLDPYRPEAKQERKRKSTGKQGSLF